MGDLPGIKAREIRRMAAGIKVREISKKEEERRFRWIRDGGGAINLPNIIILDLARRYPGYIFPARNG